MSYVTYYRWHDGGRPWASVTIKPQETLEDVARAFRQAPGWLGKPLNPAYFCVQHPDHGALTPMQHVLDAYPDPAKQ